MTTGDKHLRRSSPPPVSPPLPLKTRLQLSLLTLISDTVRRRDGTLNRRLFNLLDHRIPPSPTSRHGVSSHDISLSPQLSYRLFLPHTTHNSPLPVIVFFHGGGFVFLRSSSIPYDAVCRRLSRHLSAVIISVDYRLSPEHKFPSQYDDGFSVLTSLDTNPPSLLPPSASISSTFLAGDSAGGNLAHHLAVRATESTFSTLHVIGLISIQPFFGGPHPTPSEIRLEGAPIVNLDRSRWMWRAFLPPGLGLDHWAVNVSGPNAVDVSGLKSFPPTILFVGGFDPLQDRQRRYYEWLKRSGKEVKLVEYLNGIHAFYVFPELPESDLLIHEVKSFVDAQCSKSMTNSSRGGNLVG